MTTLSTSSIVSTTIAAYMYDLEDLKTACVTLITEHAAAVMLSKAFLNLSKTHTHIWRNLRVLLGAPTEEEDSDPDGDDNNEAAVGRTTSVVAAEEEVSIIVPLPQGIGSSGTGSGSGAGTGSGDSSGGKRGDKRRPMETDDDGGGSVETTASVQPQPKRRK